ncbi:uridine kinase [Allobranchiibius sp. GilTou73]|uniref:uridine kinase n=1 Tax=Allobranchiibius sp. GilTou73 TaxID=2904523 RepID=UPI001F30E06D|nr:uridine kinase [Allobranchiibius sp. GilTou73]UIJ33954.1 uridine kinase [Allobranchiibius sp. GilTou73]
MTVREQVVSALADQLTAADIGHPLRVGIDGPCGSGKTTLAVQLTQAVSARGRAAVHVDSDGFHNAQGIRYRQGRDSARGYYDDAYNFDALVERVLLPLGPDGSRVYTTKVHDMGTDRVVTDEMATAPRDAVVVFGCTFLQRGSLSACWDGVIYLEVRREIAFARGVARDAEALGGDDNARRAYADRYMAAYDLYVREERPAEKASIVVNQDDFAAPRIVRGPQVRDPRCDPGH